MFLSFDEIEQQLTEKYSACVLADEIGYNLI
jgi:hypothetical protein